MTAVVDTLPDVEAALKAWMLADDDIASTFGTRIFDGLPAQVDMPAITGPARIAGGDRGGEASIDDAVVTLNVWGPTGDKPSTTAALNVLRASLGRLRLRSADVTLDATTVRLSRCKVDLALYRPDFTPTAGVQPRWIVTVRVSALVIA